MGSVNNSIITRAGAILLEHDRSQGLQSTFQIQIRVLSNYPIFSFVHSLLTCPISSSRPEPIFLHTFLFLLVINLERVKTRKKTNKSYMSKHIFKGKMSSSDHILFLLVPYSMKRRVNVKYSILLEKILKPVQDRLALNPYYISNQIIKMLVTIFFNFFFYC